MGEATDMLAATGGAGLPREGGGLTSMAGPASVASLGLSAYGSIVKGQGTQAADEMQAERAERAAQFGRLQAELTDTTLRERLNTTLANIDVIRSAGRVDPTSPTTAAVEDRNRVLSDRQRTASVLSLKQQAADDDASAKYLREAGQYANSMGYLNAGIDVAGALSKAVVA